MLAHEARSCWAQTLFTDTKTNLTRYEKVPQTELTAILKNLQMAEAKRNSSVLGADADGNGDVSTPTKRFAEDEPGVDYEASMAEPEPGSSTANQPADEEDEPLQWRRKSKKSKISRPVEKASIVEPENRPDAEPEPKKSKPRQKTSVSGRPEPDPPNLRRSPRLLARSAARCQNSSPTSAPSTSNAKARLIIR